MSVTSRTVDCLLCCRAGHAWTTWGGCDINTTGLVEVAVPEGDWQAMLTQRRIPEVLRDRPPRIGDAFGVMLERRNARQLLHPIGPVVDITADARDAARAAFYGAVASPLDPSTATAVAEQAEDRIEPVPEPKDWRAHVMRRAP